MVCVSPPNYPEHGLCRLQDTSRWESHAPFSSEHEKQLETRVWLLMERERELCRNCRVLPARECMDVLASQCFSPIRPDLHASETLTGRSACICFSARSSRAESWDRVALISIVRALGRRSGAAWTVCSKQRLSCIWLLSQSSFTACRWQSQPFPPVTLWGCFFNCGTFNRFELLFNLFRPH